VKAINFKEANVIFAEGQDEYHNLHAHITETGEVTSCWKMSFRERIEALISGNIYLQVLTFRKPLQPIKLSTYKPPLRD
jgi:hypothetical protein